MTKKKILKKIESIGIAIFFILCLSTLSKANAFLINTICLWGLGGIYIALFLYFGIFQYSAKAVIDNRSRIIYGMIAGIFSLLLLLMLPIRYGTVLKENILESFWYQGDTIILENIGEKNSDSLGHAIWIEGIVQDGKDYNLYEIPLTEGWRFEDGRIVSDSITSKPLPLELLEKKPYRILFRKQKDAGCVRIKMGDYIGVVDLYQEKYEQHFEIEWKDIIELDFSFLSIKRIIFYGLEFCIIWMIVFVLISYLGNSYRKKKQTINNL